MNVPPLARVRWLDYLRDRPDLLAAAANLSPEDQGELRADHPADAVAAALTLAELRRRAADRFTRAAGLWCDRVRLEQATAESVARHKARRFAGADRPVLDLCGGMGGDAVALAAGGPVVSFDRDPAATWMTAANAALYGVDERVTAGTADVTDDGVSGPAALAGRLVHVDPDRRPGGDRASARRERRIEDYAPGLPFLHHLVARAAGGAVKVSPAANWGGKFPGCEVELISAGGECREATVWFGALADPHAHRATVLAADGPGADVTTATLCADPFAAVPRVGPPGEYVFDPDPSVVRAGLVDHLCERSGLRRLDDAEEYLTGDSLPPAAFAPFVTAFRVLELCPNNPRRYRAAVRSAGASDVEVKCRHLPISAAAVRRKLPLAAGEPRRTLIFARVAGKATALLCDRLTLNDSHGSVATP